MTKKLISGLLELHYDGYGFVRPEEKGEPDAFIPAHAVGDALHRDRVEVALQPGRHGKTEGRITRILERGFKQLVGRYELRGKSAIVVTDDFRVKRRVIIPSKCDGGAHHNEMVIAKILEYPQGDRPVTGKVVKRLGSRGSDQTELNILIARHNLPQEFPKTAVEEAKRVSGNFHDKSEGRREDLTGLPFITIDGEDAKDFDDAVCAERVNENSIRVWVAIADVSNFVVPGSALDKEAALRATSVYLPGFCIPMLPEELSCDICSLIPQENRYCLTAEMVIESDGSVSKSRFYKSLIRSQYRMTYTEANDRLQTSDLRQQTLDGAILNSLRTLNEAAEYFRKGRRARGSIDFDLPEPQIVLDLTGRPENIIKRERNAAHMLIEDLMIAANEATALFLTRKGFPCIFRVHDRPDSEKLIELKALLKYLGHDIKIAKNPEPTVLAQVVKRVEGRPEERLINMLLLRCMAQAIYSTENIGHFGLASKCYCHFTSPIRRYPDLLVHRLLGWALDPSAPPQDDTAHVILREKRPKNPVKNLRKEAEHSSKMERKSMEAEWEALDLYSAIFMRDKIGEVYDGLVSHAAKKGIFVELIDYFVEGIIKPEDLIGDRFSFEPKKFAYVGKKTGSSIHIGDRIKVAVKDVKIEERQIYFEPA